MNIFKRIKCAIFGHKWVPAAPGSVVFSCACGAELNYIRISLTELEMYDAPAERQPAPLRLVWSAPPGHLPPRARGVAAGGHQHLGVVGDSARPPREP